MRYAAAVLLLLVAAGCGGSSGDPLGGGARSVPPDAVAFFAARTDAPHWRELARAVLHFVPRVPAGAREIDVAILQGGRRVVVTGVRARPAGSLADDAEYRDMQATLPRGVTAFAYLRGDVTGRRLLAIPGQIGTAVFDFRMRFRVAAHPTTRPSNALLRWRWGAAWLTADGIGARARSAGPPLAQSNRVRTVQVLARPYAPTLLDEIPADAQRVVDLLLPQSAFELMQRLPPPLARRFPRAGFDLPIELDAILGGETALYTRPGGEVTLVSSPADANGAVRALAALGLGTLHRAFIGGQLVLSTGAAGIAALRGGAEKLSADRAFRDAHVPAEVTGLVYVRGRLAAWAVPDNGDATFTVHFTARR